MVDLKVFFQPKSVAIFGASRDKKKPGRIVLDNLVQSGFSGEIYPVNPNATEIAGFQVYRPEELPKLELAVFVIPAQLVAAELRKIASKTKGALILSGGFGEIGKTELDQQLLEICEHYDIRILGPNCLGTMNTNANFNSMFLPLSKVPFPKKGKISILSQSGATIASLIDWGAEMGLGISKLASYGNQLDIADWEILEYFAKDKNTDVIGWYVEGVKNGRKLIEKAKKIKKPVIVMKAGRCEKGIEAAKSHTGALAGQYKVFHGIMNQLGFGSSENLCDFLDSLKILDSWTSIGDRVAVITCGGGFGVMATDSLESKGLKLAELSKKTQQDLKNSFPDRVATNNPVDLTGDADTAMFEKAIKIIQKDRAVDTILVILLMQLPKLDEQVINMLNQLGNGKKPIIVVSPPGKHASTLNTQLSLPVFDSTERAVKSIKLAYDSITKQR
ncbi:MAG: CoA-binding protein [Candidatus Altiarchaeota archaeon]|nr:CoA-binding protein [Candidatus Altiarchaeota archaeon]